MHYPFFGFKENQQSKLTNRMEILEFSQKHNNLSGLFYLQCFDNFFFQGGCLISNFTIDYEVQSLVCGRTINEVFVVFINIHEIHFRIYSFFLNKITDLQVKFFSEGFLKERLRHYHFFV